MHGAPGTFTYKASPKIHLRTTGHGRGLPYPATFKQTLFRRSRSNVVLGAIIAALVLYILLRDSSFHAHVSHVSPPTHDLQNNGASFPPPVGSPNDENFLPGPPVPANVAARFHLEGLPVKIPVRPKPKVPVATRESVFTDPWPEEPKIAEFWLSESRLENIPAGFPNWPAESNKDSSERQKLSKIPWASLFRPSGYKGPVALEDDLPGKSAEWSRIQASRYDENDDDAAIRRARQDWVRRAFLHAWKGYKNKAWGHDEVKPIHGKVSNGFNGWGATIVDSLSTLLLLNLTEEYSLARTHVRQIDFSKIVGEKSVYGSLKDARTVPIFETVIRYLGGLLSAYDLSGGDTLMLERAEDLAGWLMGAFE